MDKSVTPSVAKSDNIDFSVVWQFFGDIPIKYRKKLKPFFEPVRLLPNERLIQQGEVGDSLYIILKGQLRVINEEAEESEVFLTFKEPGEGVGEISLLTGERRSATVDAVIASELVSLSRKNLEVFTATALEASHFLTEELLRRIHQSRLNHVLMMTNVFKQLEENVLQDIKAKLEPVTVASGKTIMQVGDPGDALYIVISGRLRVISPVADGERPYQLDTHRGQTVGEIGLITGKRRTATVLALRDSLLAKLSRDSFNWLLQKHPEAMLSQFAGPIIERLQNELTDNKLTTHTVTTITLIATDITVPLSAFTTKFNDSLGKLGSTMLLNSKRCDDILGSENIAYLSDDDPANDRFVFWLNEQEANHDYVVYEADYEPTAWTKRSIRQADIVLIVEKSDLSFTFLRV